MTDSDLVREGRRPATGPGVIGRSLTVARPTSLAMIWSGRADLGRDYAGEDPTRLQPQPSGSQSASLNGLEAEVTSNALSTVLLWRTSR